MVSAADLKRYYLEGTSPASEDQIDASAARRLGLSMFDYLKRKVKTPPCAALIRAHSMTGDRELA